MKSIRSWSRSHGILAISPSFATAQGEIDVVLGDGRLMLQQAPSGVHDLIILDAFSSDGIPAHLLTREAMQLYLSALVPDGIIAAHISNRYLHLEPLVAALTTSWACLRSRTATCRSARLHVRGDACHRTGSSRREIARLSPISWACPVGER